ncbi:MAG: tetratricopeptide repeat protein [Porticoccaceae bacterium]|nr:tetratricopeptide repeat protein [Porticoccaceae bacterium]
MYNMGTSNLLAYRHSLTMIKGFLILMLMLFALISRGQVDKDQTDTIESYLTAIDGLEAEHGAYSSQLSDLYLGLGKSYSSKTEYSDALAAFQRGMQIERVNFGLHSLSQTPYLTSIADTESNLGNQEKSLKALNQVYQISAKNYGDTDKRMVPVINSLIDWHMNIYHQQRPKVGYSNLVMSERLANDMNFILDENISLNHPEGPTYYRRIADLHYVIANHITKHGEPRETGFTVSSGLDSRRRSEVRTSYRHFHRGKTALERVVQASIEQGNSTPYDQANVIADLGDWYLLFGQKLSAIKAYQLADETLDSDENPENARQSLFGSPKIIEFGIKKQDQDTIPSENKSMSVQVSMLISEGGVASDFYLANESDSLTDNEMKLLKKYFRGKRFRPRIVERQPQEAIHVVNYDRPAIGVAD